MTVDINVLKAAGLTDEQIDLAIRTVAGGLIPPEVHVIGPTVEAVPAEPVAVPQARDASDYRTPVSPEPEPVEKSTASEPDVPPASDWTVVEAVASQAVKPSRSVLHAALDAFLDAAGF
jgi:hypothetical protein